MMVQLSSAGMLAPVSLSELAVFESDIPVPIQVVVSAGVVGISRLRGSVALKLDRMSVKPFGFDKVIASIETVFWPTLVGEKDSLTVGAQLGKGGGNLGAIERLRQENHVHAGRQLARSRNTEAHALRQRGNVSGTRLRLRHAVAAGPHPENHRLDHGVARCRAKSDDQAICLRTDCNRVHSHRIRFRARCA
jgi:hypothetical protein